MLCLKAATAYTLVELLATVHSLWLPTLPHEVHLHVCPIWYCGKSKGEYPQSTSILVQGHYTGTLWPHPPDTVTQQHHLVSTQLVLSEPFMPAYSQQV